jgi:hypothetical protein
MDILMVPISPGELLDKITILRIKSARLSDQTKLANVRRELTLLEQTWQRSLPDDHAIAADAAELQQVNGELWEIEDRIRELEAQQRFDAGFIELARSVYLRNDQRAAIKHRINRKLNSAIIEEKSYQPYHKS